MNLTTTNRTEIVKGFFIWVPPHHEQYYRPYNVNLDKRAIDSLVSATEEGTNISDRSLARAGNIISPSASPSGTVILPHGMSQGRYAFYLEASTPTPFGAIRELITGFTDHDDVTPQGNVNPDMVLTINNIIRLDSRESAGVNGFDSRMTVRSSSNAFSSFDNNAFTLRPEDVIGNLELSSRIQSMGGADANTVIHTNRNDLSGDLLLGDRDNNISTKYLSNVLGSYIGALDTQMVVGDGPESFDTGTEAYGMARGSTWSSSPFIKTIHDPMNPNSTKQLTISRLEYLWPREANFYKFQTPSASRFNQMAGPTDFLGTETWGGVNVEKQVMYAINQIVPSLLSKLLILNVSLEVTNRTPDGRPIVEFSAPPKEMFPGYLQSAHLSFLQEQILLHVVESVLHNYCTDFYISMNLSLLDNAMYRISLNGEPPVDYAAPLYCDSHYSPNIGSGKNNSLELGAGLEHVSSILSTHRHKGHGQADILAESNVGNVGGFDNQNSGGFESDFANNDLESQWGL